jgi:hypothetical protein
MIAAPGDVIGTTNIVVPFNYIGNLPKAISVSVNDIQVAIVPPSANSVEIDLSAFPNGMLAGMRVGAG